MRTADWSESVSVLDRITAVFEAFDHDDDGLGVTELARRANLPKSTVSRIAAELVEDRFLERDGDKLHLGIRLYELGQNVDEPRRLRRIASPVMAELRDLTGCTVTLAVVERSEVLNIAVARGRHALGALGEVGASAPVAGSALGQAALHATTRAPSTAEVCVVTNEHDSGLTCLALPVATHDRARGALSLCAPDDGIDVAALSELLRRAVGALGHRFSRAR